MLHNPGQITLCVGTICKAKHDFKLFFFSLEVGNIPGSVQGEEFQVLLQLLLWLPATRPLVLQLQHSLINVVQTADSPALGSGIAHQLCLLIFSA